MWISGEGVSSTCPEFTAYIAATLRITKIAGLQITFITGLHTAYMANAKDRLRKEHGAWTLPQ